MIGSRSPCALRRAKHWHTDADPTEWGVHVWPCHDDIDHDLESVGDCVCGPEMAWVDVETGETFVNGPVVTHRSLDGRERAE